MVKQFGIVLVFFSLTARANKPSLSEIPAAPEGVSPCKSVEIACEAAGYFADGARHGKGTEKHCVKPVLSGKKINGVTVNPSEVKACVAERARSRKQK